MAMKTPSPEKDTDETASNDEYSDRVARRAEWEAFEYELGGPGCLKIINHSHGSENAADHTYIVQVEAGKTTECTCPADEYRSGPCKHRVSIEGNEALLSAGSADVEAIEEARQ